MNCIDLYARTYTHTHTYTEHTLHTLKDVRAHTLSHSSLYDGVLWQVTFYYYALCPESACGSLKTPRRGICSMGRCLCSVPWLGDNCEILGLAPRITSVSLQTVVEGASFHKVLTTSEVCPTVSYGTTVSQSTDGIS